MKSLALALGMLASAVACTPAVVTTAEPAQPVVTVTPVLLPPGTNWGPGPAALPPGARAAVIDGDPTQAQLFTMRLWFPNDYRIPPHSHLAFEHITVISGVLHLGMGNTFNMAGPLDELRTGAFKVISPGMNHFAHAAGETVIQLHGMGPWQVNYVNPSDDPRNR